MIGRLQGPVSVFPMTDVVHDYLLVWMIDPIDEPVVANR